MNRDAAIEAVAKALDPDAWELGVRTAAWHRYEAARRKAVAVIDAALPHLVPHLKAEALREAAEDVARRVAMMHRTVRWEACDGIVKRLFDRAERIERGEP